MDPVNNNQFEVVPAKSKRKIVLPYSNVYLNPALDLLVNEDPMCNTAMEIIPVKKRKRTKSLDIVAFENSALDLGISKAAVNEFLARELENVKKNIRYESTPSVNSTNFEVLQAKFSTSEPNISFSESRNLGLEPKTDITLSESCIESNKDSSVVTVPNIEETEHIYANVTDVRYNNTNDVSISDIAGFNEQTDTINVPFIDQSHEMSIVDSNLNIENFSVQNDTAISKIDEITDSGISVEHKSYNNELVNNDLSAINTTNIQTNVTNQIFVNNPSNLSLSFLDRLALDSPNISNQSLIFDDDLNESNIMEIKTITIITKKKRIVDKKKNTNPFLDPNINQKLDDTVSNSVQNPFLTNEIEAEMEYNEEMINRPAQGPSTQVNSLMPRRLFACDTNSTISTVNESADQHEYENIDGLRPESPIYENIGEMYESNFNKQSKILGYDVSQFSAVDIMNLNKNSQGNSSNESETKKDLKHQILKASKLSKRVLKKLKKTFKGEKAVEHNTTLNPYEIPRKFPKDNKPINKDSGIENPALNLDTSDIEIEELEEDEEHQYETIKTLRNTRLNMNVTPLKERNIDSGDVSHNKTNTPGKKVRFDSTLNQQKFITGNSFDCDIQSPGFDVKIDKYHDELENCINERKFLQQNM